MNSVLKKMNQRKWRRKWTKSHIHVIKPRLFGLYYTSHTRLSPLHTRGNSWANCLAGQFAKLFPLVCGGLNLPLHHDLKDSSQCWLVVNVVWHLTYTFKHKKTWGPGWRFNYFKFTYFKCHQTLLKTRAKVHSKFIQRLRIENHLIYTLKNMDSVENDTNSLLYHILFHLTLQDVW